MINPLLLIILESLSLTSLLHWECDPRFYYYVELTFRIGGSYYPFMTPVPFSLPLFLHFPTLSLSPFLSFFLKYRKRMFLFKINLFAILSFSLSLFFVFSPLFLLTPLASSFTRNSGFCGCHFCLYQPVPYGLESHKRRVPFPGDICGRESMERGLDWQEEALPGSSLLVFRWGGFVPVSEGVAASPAQDGLGKVPADIVLLKNVPVAASLEMAQHAFHPRRPSLGHSLQLRKVFIRFPVTETVLSVAPHGDTHKTRPQRRLWRWATSKVV